MRYCIITRNDEKSNQIGNEIKPKINLIYDDVTPNYVIAIGGDGTIIKATHSYPNSIIFGIHTGHLGFFANYSIDEIEILIDDINNKSFNVDKIDLLSCKINDADGGVIYGSAINEITVVTPPRTLILDVFIDDEYFEKFRGTGFCISTPSGSTAYNKSLHGSVIDSSLKVMQLTEIAGINSNAYRTLSSPLVLSSNRRIKLDAEKPQDVFITIDHLSYNVNNFKNIEIFYDGNSIRMAYHNHESFLKRINRTFLISQE